MFPAIRTVGAVMIRHPLAIRRSDEAIDQLVDTFSHVSRRLVTNCAKGRPPRTAHQRGSYVAKYVVSPPISVRRI